jgi:hypothetical protein
LTTWRQLPVYSEAAQAKGVLLPGVELTLMVDGGDE